jgi:protein disulfide-isomerase-like protein
MFGRALLTLLLLALGAAAAASPEVLRLDADSFEPSIASRPFVAVAFVAPWCAHCKRLEPEWRAAASKLAARGRNIALATLDTTAGDANAALAARHDVRGFPSIRIFRDGDLQSAEAYEGPRAADGVVATLERLEASAEMSLATPSEAEAFVRSSPVVVLGVLDGSVEEDAPLARAFGAAARAFAGDPDDPDDWQSVPFGVVALPTLVPERTTRSFANALKEDGRGPARRGDVLVYRAFDARVSRFRFADASSGRAIAPRDRRRALERFVASRAMPRVATLDRDPRSRSTLRRVFADPGPKAIGFADDEARRREMAETMARVAEQAEREASESESESESESVDDEDARRRTPRFVVGVAAENANALAFFDVDPKRLPAVVIHDTRTDARYVLHDATDADALTEWLAAFRAGTLAPTVRSAGDGDGARGAGATPPEAEAAPSAASAAILVAKGFRNAVAGAEAPAVTLIQFHAPWCGHCESFAPTYNAVAAAFRDDEDARVVTFDADANDVPDPRFDVKGFPAVRLYRKSDDSVHAYEGARTEKALIEFVRKHVGVGGGVDARKGERDDGEL